MNTGTQIIEVPGLETPLEFPAGMSDQEIDKAIRTNFPQLFKGKETVAPPTTSPTFLSESKRVADMGIRGGLSGIPALLDLYTQAPSMVAKAAGMDLPPQTTEQQLDSVVGPETATPNTSFMGAYKAATGGEFRKPETQTGKFIGEGMQGAVGALTGPGGLIQPIRNAAIGTIGGMSGELADFMVDKDHENPIFRLLGALAGGGLTAAGTALRPNKDSLIRTATSQVPDSQWQKADEIAAFMDEKEIPYLNSQLLGPKSTLDDVVYEMSGHQAIRPGIMGHLQELPGKTNELLRSLVEKHFPINIGNRAGIIRDIKESATKRISDEWDVAGNKFSANLRPGIVDEVYSPEQINQLRARLLEGARNPAYAGEETLQAAQIEKFLKDHLRERTAGGLKEVDSAVLDASGNPYQNLVEVLAEPRTKGSINTLVKTFNAKEPPEGYDKISSKFIAEELRKFSDPDFGDARRAMTEHIENQVNPLRRSIIGDISRVGGELKPDRNTLNESVIGMMFPKDKDMTAEIQLVGKELGPDQVGNMMREFFTKAINTGEKVFDSDVAKFKQPINTLEKLVGTPTQRKNVEEGLTILTQGTDLDPKMVSKGFFDIVDNLETIRDLKIADKVGPVSIQQDAGKSLPAFVIATASRLGRSLWEKKTKETYEQIFNMLTTRDGLKQIESIARSPEPKAAQAFIRSVLASNADDMSAD